MTASERTSSRPEMLKARNNSFLRQHSDISGRPDSDTRLYRISRSSTIQEYQALKLAHFGFIVKATLT